MNLCGHVGLSIALAYSAHTLMSKSFLTRNRESSNNRISRLALSIHTTMDYRVVVMGSVAADLIDKPLGLWLTPDFVSHNTRSVGHSLIFCLILFILPVFFKKTWSKNIIIVAVASTFHLIFDQMWIHRGIVLWPIYGWGFPIVDSTTFSEYSGHVLSNLYHFYKYPWELVGMTIIVLFVIHIIYTHNVVSFLRYGKVDEWS